MKLEIIDNVDSIFSPEFEDDDESMGVCASGIITPNKKIFALNGPSPRGKYLGTHPDTHLRIMQEIFGYNNVSESTYYRVIRITIRLFFDLSSRAWKRQVIYETPKIIVPYELELLKSQIEVLKSKEIEIGGIVYDVDPRDTETKILENVKNKESIKYGKKYGEPGIDGMLQFLNDNVVLEGYSLPEMDALEK